MTEPINLIIQCPHCANPVIITKLSCGIFRHGTFKKAKGKQINPHATQSQCEMYLKKNLIFGCGKPFRVVKTETGEYVGETCGYI